MGLTDAQKRGLKSSMSTSTESVPQFIANRGLGNMAVGTPGTTVNLGSMAGGGIGPQNTLAQNRSVAPMPPIPKGAIFGA